MRLFAYAIFDSAAGVYDRPFFAHSDRAAIRGFEDICVRADHPIAAHPADYTLFRVGAYEDGKGELTGESPSRLINGVEAVSASQKVDTKQMSIVNGGIEKESKG